MKNFSKHYSSDGEITKYSSRYVSEEVEEFLKPVVYDFSPGSSKKLKQSHYRPGQEQRVPRN